MKISLFLSFSLSAQNGSFRVRSDEFVQVGYNHYNVLSFGNNTNNGDWVIEYWNEGLNFAKPYPSSRYGNYKLFISDKGNVGIGRIPDYRLDVDGDIATYGTLVVSSDERLKTNITPFLRTSSVLDRLLSVNLYNYNYFQSWPVAQSLSPELTNVSEIKAATVAGDEAASNLSQVVDPEPRLGFLAQEIQGIFPNLVKEDEAGYLSIDYLTFIPILIESIKEQQDRINGLEARILALERR